MNSGLDEACALLDEFEKEIAAVQTTWQGITKLNPDFEELSPENWQEKYHRMWLHGATKMYECSELERWLIDYPSSMVLANSPAQEMHTAWRKWLSIAGPVTVNKILDYDKKIRDYVERESEESSEAFYADHDQFKIQEPLEKETLYDFIIRLSSCFEDQHDMHQKCERKERKPGDWLEERALNSFLDFIRKNNPLEQSAFVEHIFPQKKAVHYGRIIRLLPPEAYPISESLAAEILIELARRCRSGHPVARHTALESLALSWLCIACSRIRLPKTLEIVRDINPKEILSGAEFGVSKNPTFGNKEFWRPIKQHFFCKFDLLLLLTA